MDPITLATRIAHQIASRTVPSDEDVATLLGEIKKGIPESKAIEIALLFVSFIRGGDWRRYQWYRQRLEIGESRQAVDEAWDKHQSHKKGAIAATHHDASGYRHRKAFEVNPRLQELERKVAADHVAAERIAGSIAMCQCPGSIPDLPAQLLASLPVHPLNDAYDHDIHKIHSILHQLFETLRPRVRSNKEVVRECGEQLYPLFSTDHQLRESDDWSEPFVERDPGYYQLFYLLEVYRDSRPHDPDAVAWLAQLACLAGEEKKAQGYASTLLNMADALSAPEVARLVRFVEGGTRLSRAPALMNIETRMYSLGRTEDESKWSGYFGAALAERGFANGGWNGELIAVVASLHSDDWAYPLSLMPSQCWIAAARNEGRGEYNQELLLRQALEAAIEEENDEHACIAIPFLMARAMEREDDDDLDSLSRLLEEHATTGELKDRATNTLRGLQEWTADRNKREQASNHCLTEAELKSIEEFEVYVINQCKQMTNRYKDAPVSWQPPQHNEPFVECHLGYSLYAGLHRHTKYFLCDGQRLMRLYQQSEGDEESFGNAVLSLANAVVNEVCFQANTIARSGLGTKLFGRNDRSLGAIAARLEKWRSDKSEENRKILRCLQDKGVDVLALLEIASEISDLAKIRNKACHAQKVDRELAAVVWGKWFQGRLLRRLFLAIHPKTS